MMTKLDQTDYSVAVMRRGKLAKPWRWEIYRAGTSVPVKRSTVLYESMTNAARAGKKATADFLAEA